jgi:hypothetical protein
MNSLRRPGEADRSACILRGAISSGVMMPIHHPDPETFFLVTGELETTWVRLSAGDVFHVRGRAKHALRNRSKEPVVLIVPATAKMARLFREIGDPVSSSEAPSPRRAKTILRFVEVTKRYG